VDDVTMNVAVERVALRTRVEFLRELLALEIARMTRGTTSD
jgi:hypothetical protein